MYILLIIGLQIFKKSLQYYEVAFQNFCIFVHAIFRDIDELYSRFLEIRCIISFLFFEFDANSPFTLIHFNNQIMFFLGKKNCILDINNLSLFI